MGIIVPYKKRWQCFGLEAKNLTFEGIYPDFVFLQAGRCCIPCVLLDAVRVLQEFSFRSKY